MATRAIQGTAPALEALPRSRDAVLRTAEAPETNGAGFFGTLGHGVRAMSFQLGLTGTSSLSYNDSTALSLKDKALLDALTMGYSQ